MNVVDSSGWLEYFAEGPNADFFASAIQNTSELVVPCICIYEVFKRTCQQRGEDAAFYSVTAMMQGLVVDLDTPLALRAARISMDLKLPMADSMVLATARAFGATFWTQDADFKDIAEVRYIQKR